MAFLKSQALSIDGDGKRQTFRGSGDFDMEWLTRCMALFKSEKIVIRNLAIHPDFRQYNNLPKSKQKRCLIITFDTPANTSSFLEQFKEQLQSICWD